MPRLALLIFLAAIAAVVHAQETALAWTLRPGDSFSVEYRVITSMALESRDKPFRQKSSVVLVTNWQIREVKDEVAVAQVSVEKMDSKTSAGKEDVQSKDDAVWEKATFTITFDRHGQVRKLEGYDELLQKLAASNESRLKILRTLKPPEAFRALLQEGLGPLPTDAVAAGATWKRHWTEPMAIFGSFEHTTTYAYRGLKDGMHHVESKTTTAFKEPRYAIENDVFRVLKGEVTADEANGSFSFDAATGRMQRVERQGKLRGVLMLEALGGSQRVQFESDYHLTIRIMGRDENR